MEQHTPYLLELSFAHVIEMYFGPVFVQKSCMAALLPVPTSTTAEYPKSKQYEETQHVVCRWRIQHFQRTCGYQGTCYIELLQHNVTGISDTVCHCTVMYPHLAYPCFPNYLFITAFFSLYGKISIDRLSERLNLLSVVYQKQHTESFVKGDTWQKWPVKYLKGSVILLQRCRKSISSLVLSTMFHNYSSLSSRLSSFHHTFHSLCSFTAEINIQPCVFTHCRSSLAHAKH